MRRKVAYLALEDPDAEFEFYLADRLHMTVAELRDRMSHAEYVQWGVYHARKAQRQELEQKRQGVTR